MTSASQRYLIVGLGNPGRIYRNTRHNIGFKIVEAFAKHLSLTFRKNQKLKSYVAAGIWNEKKIYLLMPQTYMNRSGEAVRLSVDYFKISNAQLIVIVDDAAISFGEFRLREKGSSGGHNGLRSIEENLGSKNYPRFRIGIGDSHSGDLEKHVLSKFSRDEKKKLEPLIDQAVELIEIWTEKGILRAMNQANVRKIKIFEDEDKE